MKTLLIIDSARGTASGHLATLMLGAAAAKAGLTWVEKADEAELVIVAGSTVPADSALNGKKVYLGDLDKAVRDPDAFLADAVVSAQPYQAAVATPAVTHQAKTYCCYYCLPNRRSSHLYGG